MDSSFFNFLSSQIESDYIPPDVNNTEIGKANKSVKIWTQILFKLSGSMYFKWKNEEESQCPVCKVNTLKVDISSSFDLQTLLSLLKI